MLNCGPSYNGLILCHRISNSEYVIQYSVVSLLDRALQALSDPYCQSMCPSVCLCLCVGN